MSDNDIGPSGATALANALEVNKTLQRIDLEGTLVFDNVMVGFNAPALAPGWPNPNRERNLYPQR